VMSVTAATTGRGLIVIMNDFEFPPILVQLLAVAVTVIVDVISAPVWLSAAVNEMSPVPEAATSPIAGFELVQFIVAPATLLRKGKETAPLTSTCGQKLWSEIAVTTGSGLTVTVISFATPRQLGAAVAVGVTVYLIIPFVPETFRSGGKCSSGPLPVWFKTAPVMLGSIELTNQLNVLVRLVKASRLTTELGCEPLHTDWAVGVRTGAVTIVTVLVG